MAVGVIVSLAIYAAVVLPYILKVKVDIDEYHPRAI